MSWFGVLVRPRALAAVCAHLHKLVVARVPRRKLIKVGSLLYGLVHKSFRIWPHRWRHVDDIPVYDAFDRGTVVATSKVYRCVCGAMRKEAHQSFYFTEEKRGQTRRRPYQFERSLFSHPSNPNLFMFNEGETRGDDGTGPK